MTLEQKAAQLIEAMGRDNGCKFVPAPEQKRKLVEGLQRMRQAGCRLTPWQLDTMAMGEQTSQDRLAAKYDGKAASKALTVIFDGATL